MNKNLLIGIIALLLLLIGGGAWEIIRPKPKPEVITEYETLTVTKTDTMYLKSPPKVFYKDRVEYVMRDMPRDSCCPTLERCFLDQFFLSNLEAEVEKTVQGGSVLAQWSTPMYLESGNGFHIEARFSPLPAQVIEVEKPRNFFDRFGYGLHATGGIDTQGKPSAVVGVGFHFDAKGIF
jgi:hypothetical protein